MTSQKTINLTPLAPVQALFRKEMAFFALLFCMPIFLSAQASQNFEGITGVALNNSTCYYFDFNTTSAHEIQNYAPACGGTITVKQAPAGASLGFSIILDPLAGNGPTGFSDGDAFGVATGGALNVELGTGAPEGSQAFLMEDVDGVVEMKFSEVDLTGTASPQVSLQWFLAETGWESADFLTISVEISNCGSATTLDLFNTAGSDIDDLMIEDAWTTAMQDLTLYALDDCTAQLVITHSSNSSSEELGIDNIVFSEGLILPIELKDFSATEVKGAVALDWGTLSEKDNEGFMIQHSKDGMNWEDLDFVAGAGTSFLEQRYSFLHETPSAGVNYYRLKQMDYNGAFDFSPVEVVALEGTVGRTELRIAPNPTSDDITVTLPEALEDSRELTFQIYNQIGQIVKSEIRSPEDTRFDLQDLSNGFYMITIQKNGVLYSSRFIKE